jgi:hypothetical protein
MRIGSSPRVKVVLSVVAFSLIAPGCSRGPETDYGVSRGASLNGTSVFAAMLAERGHKTRVALRLTDELADQAQGIVRFALHPGPPAKDEAAWFHSWLARDRDRWLIYVVRDYDTAAEYWKQIRDGISQAEDPRRYAEAEEERSEAAGWVAKLPEKPKEVADPKVWFTMDEAWAPPRVCTKLSGAWAKGIDAEAALLTVHEPLKADPRCVLLEADGKPIVIDKTRPGQPRVLVVANGSFLLNEALVNPARRPLAEQVADWPVSFGDQVALVEGGYVLDDGRMPTLWDLLRRIAALRWVAIQVGLAGLIAALARAPRLGRPRPEAASGAERPAAHAEALGSLLEQTRAAGDARELLERYRHWRGAQASREPVRSSARAHSPNRAAAKRPAGPSPAAASLKPADPAPADARAR